MFKDLCKSSSLEHCIA